MEKKFILQIFILMVVALGAVALGFNQTFVRNITQTLTNSPASQTPTVSQNKLARILDSTNNQERARLNIVIADEDSEKSLGLGSTEVLAPDAGMLFLYDQSGKYTYWMKGLEYPLDFIWIQDDTIADILPNVPAPSPNTPDEDLPRYTSRTPVNKVLEVNGGFIATYNIQIGDKVIIEDPLLPPPPSETTQEPAVNGQPIPSVEIIIEE